MTKCFISLLFACLLCICSCSRRTFDCAEKSLDSNSYEVIDIKKKNSWYFIYLKRNDSIFKVYSKEPSDKMEFGGYCMIKKHKKYNLRLISHRDNFTFKGVNVWPVDFAGKFFVDSTEFSMEPKKKIWDLHSTPDLKGLYYLRKAITK